jgi:aromatic-L-amino-acid decarboxylase
MQHMLWKAGPAGTELEEVTLDWMRQWMGLKEKWFGQIFDTASTSTLHGIAAAREQADPDCREKGMRPGMTVYASKMVHSSVDKACIMLGIGLENLRKIETDSEFRLRPDALAKAIDEDRAAGKTPICIVPTVGTTGVTSVDPVPEVVRIAREKGGLWVHVDAAYGGAAAVVPEFQHYLNGVDEADSMVVNPHKWLMTPVDLSILYTRKPEIMRRAFSLVPDYLQYGEDPRLINLMDYGIPLGRRFRSLKLWFVMRYFGREGFIRMIRNHIEWSKEVASWIAADPRFEIVAPTTMGLVCFSLRAGDEATKRLIETINDSGFAFLSQTMIDGKYSVRWAIATYMATRDDLVDVWDRVRSVAADLQP